MWWHEKIVNGVLRHAAARGWHMDIRPCFSGVIPGSWDGDGIITQLGADDRKLTRLLKNSRCPAVSLNNNKPEIAIPRVSTDDLATGRLAAEHLLERGFTSFAFYEFGKSRESADRRYQSFSQTLEEAGFATNRLAWEAVEQDDQDPWLERLPWLAQNIRRLDKPVGIFAVNDQAAVEVIEACLMKSIAIPDQVAVLGVLNMELFRHCTTVGLSSIAFDFDQITEAACALLQRMMEGEPAPDAPVLFPPTGIMIRQSTDTLAAKSPVVARVVRYMFDHYAQPISTEDLIDIAGRSQATLFKAFRDEMQQTPGEVLMRIRMDRARHMLETTDEKIYAISQACGFGRPINLHRAFQKTLGMSPNAYRKQHRQF